jgi:hypothetical protein
MAEGAQSGKYNHNLPPNGTGGMMPGMGAMGAMGAMGGMQGMNGMQGMGAMGQGGFDPQAMAMMYQRMMMSESRRSELLITEGYRTDWTFLRYDGWRNEPHDEYGYDGSE